MTHIRRGIWIPIGLAVLAVALVAGVLLASRSRGPEPGGRPNILLIVTDDQRATGTLEVMPKTQRWFEQGGVSFPAAFVTTPLCCPSRASILTGRYAHNHHILFRVDPSLGVTWPDSAFQRSTIERYLHDAGYRTALFGKYLNGWPPQDDPQFFDEWAMIRVPRRDTYYGGEVNVNGSIQPMDAYNTTYIQDRALDFLNRSASEAAPWFLYLAVKAPHYPYTPEAKYANAAVPPMRQDPSMREADRADKPPFVRRHRAMPLRAERVRVEQLRTLMSVDNLVDSVLRDLTRLGEDRSTLAIFTSDNGLLWGEHGLTAEKLLPYTPSVSVPLLLRWPGHVTAGTTDDRLAANIDIAPTVFQAAGIRPDDATPVDGRSLLSPSDRSRLLLEYGGANGWTSIRTKAFQYTEYLDQDAVTFREYYDLRTDPWELTNLLNDGDPRDDPDVAALSTELGRDRRCVGASCP